MKLMFAIPLTAVIVSGLVWWFASGIRPSQGLADYTPATDPSGLPVGILGPADTVTPTAGNAGLLLAVEPVVVGPCVLNPIQDQEVSSQLDGVLETVSITLGQKVAKGEVLGNLDDHKLRVQVELLQIRADSNAAELIAKAQYEEANARVEYATKANSSGFKSISDLEFKSYVFQRDRFAEEMKKAHEEQDTAKKELEKAKLLLHLHQVRSGMDGVVTKIFKKSGEAVKQAEPLFRISQTAQLRIEGFCKVQHAGRLKPGLPALVEPERPGPQLLELTGHTAAVSSLAVAADGKLLASASEDGNVLLWAWPGGMRLAELNHPAAVHAVAVLPISQKGQGAAYLIVSGCADHKLRLWTATSAGKIQGPVVLTGHEGAVRSVCFSPDGKFCASGSEDRRIGIWDVPAGKFRYWVHAPGAWKQAAHQGGVTSVHFAMPGTLVSAGRDNNLKRWKLDATGSALVKTHPGRTGDVTQLDPQPGGATVCFDHGDELRLLDPSGAVVGLLHNRQHGSFKEFTRFAPSGRLLLTAAANGRIQLWKTPATPNQQQFLWHAHQAGFHQHGLLALAPGAVTPLPLGSLLSLGLTDQADADCKLLPRLWDFGGFELRYYRAPGGAAVKCAAFAPGEQVFFTGGADRVVRVWAIPPANDWQPREAVLTFIGNEVEQGTDLVRVQGVLANVYEGPRRLLPGTSVTLKIYPDDPSGN